MNKRYEEQKRRAGLSNRAAFHWVTTETLRQGEFGLKIKAFEEYGIQKEACLEDTLKMLATFIQISYRVFSNPIDHLRRSYRDFYWEFSWRKDDDTTVGVVTSSDYVWCFECDGDIGLVAATHKSAEHRPFEIAYLHDGDYEAFKRVWPVEKLRSAGCRMVLRDRFV